jgi:ABC-type uncharacterized transport system involved in gliding motility auxiliary subunit
MMKTKQNLSIYHALKSFKIFYMYIYIQNIIFVIFNTLNITYFQSDIYIKKIYSIIVN